MTRHGKCETCRRRKVKCDEVVPRCGPCSVKKRPCHYTNTGFVHEQKSQGQENFMVRLDASENKVKEKKFALRLRRSRKAEEDHGEFLVFESRKPRNPSPDPAAIFQNSEEAPEWDFGYEALRLRPFDAWVRVAWPTGSSRTCLELAAKYAQESALAFQDQHSEESMSRANSAGVEALRSLQDCISAWPEGIDREALIAAVMFHFAAEHFLGIASWRYMPHLRGVGRLLASCSPDDAHNAAIQSVVSSICAHEAVASILLGEPSQLEDVPRPQLSTLGLPQAEINLDVAAQTIDDILISLPRLVCIVRAAAQDYDDLQSMATAVKLAKCLFNSNLDPMLRKAIENQSQSTDAKDKTPFEKCLEFESVTAFMVAIRYFGYRMIICGLLQTLASIDTYELFLDRTTAAEARTGSVDAAMSTVMCLDYALRPGRIRNFLAMEMVWPLEACTGIFMDIQASESSMESSEYIQAAQMVERCAGSLCQISRRWRAGCMPPWRMRELYDVFRGGPLVPDAYDYQHTENEPKFPAFIEHGLQDASQENTPSAFFEDLDFDSLDYDGFVIFS